MANRELPPSLKGHGEFERIEPTSHEFRARRNVFALSIAIILFVAAGGELNPGTYGLIRIGNATILEPVFYLAFLWAVYRYRVVCFDRTIDFHKKAISLIEQNVGWGLKSNWMDLSARYAESVKDINKEQENVIKSKLGSVPANAEELKGISSQISYNTYWNKAIPDLLHGSNFIIKGRKNSDPGSYVFLAQINIDPSATRCLFVRSYKFLIRYDDSFSEWIVPWFLISVAFAMLYYKLGCEIASALG